MSPRLQSNPVIEARARASADIVVSDDVPTDGVVSRVGKHPDAIVGPIVDDVVVIDQVVVGVPDDAVSEGERPVRAQVSLGGRDVVLDAQVRKAVVPAALDVDAGVEVRNGPVGDDHAAPPNYADADSISHVGHPEYGVAVQVEPDAITTHDEPSAGAGADVAVQSRVDGDHVS